MVPPIKDHFAIMKSVDQSNSSNGTKENVEKRRENIDRRPATYHQVQQQQSSHGDAYYGWSIGNMIREIPDCDEKRLLKYEIHEIIRRVHHYVINTNKIPSQHFYPPPSTHYQLQTQPLIGQLPPRVLFTPVIGQSPHHVISPQSVTGQTLQPYSWKQKTTTSKTSSQTFYKTVTRKSLVINKSYTFVLLSLIHI